MYHPIREACERNARGAREGTCVDRPAADLSDENTAKRERATRTCGARPTNGDCHEEEGWAYCEWEEKKYVLPSGSEVSYHQFCQVNQNCSSEDIEMRRTCGSQALGQVATAAFIAKAGTDYGVDWDPLSTAGCARCDGEWSPHSWVRCHNLE